jgi:hypothetical protein
VKGNKGTLEMGSALKFGFNNVKEPKKRKKKLINIIYNRLLHALLAYITPTEVKKTTIGVKS